MDTRTLNNVTAHRKKPITKASAFAFFISLLLLCSLFQFKVWAAENTHIPLLPVKGPTLEPKKGRFLVATDNLVNTSFKETVILMTHFSARGATGIAINRPANIQLDEAFPGIKSIQGYRETLFLGGPVKTDAIFVLMKTKRPHNYMRQITNGIYFAAGLGAITHGLPKLNKDESVRAYAGYAGWTAGQLQTEIKRGDWLIVEANPKIVFEENTDSLWSRLHQTWSGNWI